MSGYELSHGTSFSEHSLLEVIHDIEPDHLNRKCLTDSFGYAHGKHVVGESEHSSNDLFESFLTGFAEDSAAKLERSEIRRELVF